MSRLNGLLPPVNGTPGGGPPVLLDHTGRPIRTVDEMAVPHVYTYSALLRSGARTYFHQWDEAMKQSRQNALALRTDPHLMGCLKERKRAVCNLKWQLEPDDPRDPFQQAVAEELTRIVTKIPRFLRLKTYLKEDIWYGRYGATMKWDWKQQEPSGMNGAAAAVGMQDPAVMNPLRRGYRYLTLVKHRPVNGDKIGFHEDGTPYLLINWAMRDQFPKSELVTNSTGGLGLLLRGSWRDKVLISITDPDDADFYEPEMAARVYGVGVRSYLAMSAFCRLEFYSWAVEALERWGLGIVYVEYPAGNAPAKAEAEKAAKEFSRRSVLMVPVAPGGGGRGADGGSIRVVETPTAGLEAVLRLREYHEGLENRFINGQISSFSNDAEGMGTHDQTFQMQTKSDVTQSDAQDLDETLTGSDEEFGLIHFIKAHTFPQAKSFDVRYVSQVQKVDPEKLLGAANLAFAMGASFKESEILAATGFSQPIEGEATLSQMGLMMQQSALAPPPGTAPGGPEGQAADAAPGGEPPALGDEDIDAMMGGGQPPPGASYQRGHLERLALHYEGRGDTRRAAFVRGLLAYRAPEPAPPPGGFSRQQRQSGQHPPLVPPLPHPVTPGLTPTTRVAQTAGHTAPVPVPKTPLLKGIGPAGTRSYEASNVHGGYSSTSGYALQALMGNYTGTSGMGDKPTSWYGTALPGRDEKTRDLAADVHGNGWDKWPVLVSHLQETGHPLADVFARSALHDEVAGALSRNGHGILNQFPQHGNWDVRAGAESAGTAIPHSLLHDSLANEALRFQDQHATLPEAVHAAVNEYFPEGASSGHAVQHYKDLAPHIDPHGGLDDWLRSKMGDPEEYARRGEPLPYAAPAAAPDPRAVAAAVLAANSPNRMTGLTPNIPELFDRVSPQHPGLTEPYFHHLLRHMQAQDLGTMQQWGGSGPDQMEKVTGYPRARFPLHPRGGYAAWFAHQPDAAARVGGMAPPPPLPAAGPQAYGADGAPLPYADPTPFNPAQHPRRASLDPSQPSAFVSTTGQSPMPAPIPGRSPPLATPTSGMPQQQPLPGPGQVAAHLGTGADRAALLMQAGAVPWHQMTPEDHGAMRGALGQGSLSQLYRLLEAKENARLGDPMNPSHGAARDLLRGTLRDFPEGPEVPPDEANRHHAHRVRFDGMDPGQQIALRALLRPLPRVAGVPDAHYLPRGLDLSRALGFPVHATPLAEPTTLVPDYEDPASLHYAAPPAPGVEPGPSYLAPAVRPPGLRAVHSLAVPLHFNPPQLKGSGKTGQVTIDDVGRHMDALHMARHGRVFDIFDKADRAKMAKSATEEAKFQLGQPVTGENWYLDDLKHAFNQTSHAIPRMRRNESLKTIMLGASSALSGLQYADQNWPQAGHALMHYEKTGGKNGGHFSVVWPEGHRNAPGYLGGAKQAPSNIRGMGMLQHLIQKFGEKGAAEFLLSPHTVRDLGQIQKEARWPHLHGLDQLPEKWDFKEGAPMYKTGSQYPASMNDEMLPGSHLFGPKKGPFVDALSGDPNAVVVDRHHTREWNRNQGRMVDALGGIIDDPDSPEHRTAIQEATRDVANNLGRAPSATQAIQWFHAQQFANRMGTYTRSTTYGQGADNFRRDLDELRAARERGPAV